jgi:hypothetical protein
MNKRIKILNNLRNQQNILKMRESIHTKVNNIKKIMTNK